ncbi:MAG: EAL domain-containing protein [Hyphomonadaceae bacterium]|jgi:diguanylate cyclase (GGDEF)-like protein|nr:EAL domain-containing protein [Hyphomonadaceae bacterium]
MYRVLSCIATEHDLRLVLLAALICATAAFTSFRIYARAVDAHAVRDQKYSRLAWLGLTGISTGAGIWSTHFVAMLAYDSGFPTAYDPAYTLASLVVAIGVTTIGYLVSAGSPEPVEEGQRGAGGAGDWFVAYRADVRVALGGAVVGAGIGMMHYIGMAAVIVPGVIQWDTSCVAVSVVLGIVLASAGMVANRRLEARKAWWVAPAFLTVAICSLHFTAMAAVTVVPDPTIVVHPSVINTVGMAFAVAGVTMLVMLAAIGAALVNAHAEREVERKLLRQNEILQQRDKELEIQNAQLAQQHALLKQQEQALKAQNVRLDAALNNMVQGLAMFDPEQRLVLANSRYAEIYGLSAEEIAPGTTLKQILEHRSAKGYLAGRTVDGLLKSMLSRMSGNETCHFTTQLLNGRSISVSVQPMADGGTVTTHHDITEKRRSEAKIAHMALHDALTGLPNRVLLNERIEHALTRVRGDNIVAVHLLDLDLFKNVNDTLGHPAGDKLLKMVTARLQSSLREADTVARMGGDEFAIVQASIAEPAEAMALALRIIAAVSEPYEIDGQQVIIGTSVGIAIGPADGRSPDQLLRNADLALYRAKDDGRGMYCFFEPEMDARVQARRGMEYDLRRALVEGEFELHYQPAVNIEDNTISGFEALIRWRHPRKGMIAPSTFIPVAEENGFVIPLGEWVLRQACAAAATWPAHTKIAVNLSPVQFRSAGLVQTVMSALAASRLLPHRLELEITETTLMQESEATLGVLFQLRELGVRIALDDFGTGYSSLSHLQSFPFDRIKIDRSFIKDIADPGSLNIVRAVTALARGLGMETTAEGVETQQQFHAVKLEGCTEMQGYLFSRPRPAHEISRTYFPDLVTQQDEQTAPKLQLSA